MRTAQQAQSAGNSASQADFRQLMGRFATGVCIVSVERPGGVVAAMTVNSFVSVSLDPMLISWSIQNASSQFNIYAGAERFAVSILSEQQADLARRYAARGDSQLQEADFTESPAGLPIIPDCLGFLECRRWSDYLAGDHTMIFGEVIGLNLHSFDQDMPAPLGFFNGRFCSIDQ